MLSSTLFVLFDKVSGRLTIITYFYLLSLVYDTQFVPHRHTGIHFWVIPIANNKTILWWFWCKNIGISWLFRHKKEGCSPPIIPYYFILAFTLPRILVLPLASGF